MLTTKFRVWLQDVRITPVWTGVKVVGGPEQVKARCIEVTVEGNGYDLLRLIAKRQDIFAVYLQMKPENPEDHLAMPEPPRHPHRQQNKAEQYQERNRIYEYPWQCSPPLTG